MQDQTASRVEQLAAVQAEARELFARKNMDYGDSFAADGPIGALIRLGDKLQRCKQVSATSVRLVNDECLRDTLIDIHNYSAMIIMLLDEHLKAKVKCNELTQLSEQFGLYDAELKQL